jgi:hypothetical protein
LSGSPDGHARLVDTRSTGVDPGKYHVVTSTFGCYSMTC